MTSSPVDAASVWRRRPPPAARRRHQPRLHQRIDAPDLEQHAAQQPALIIGRLSAVRVAGPAISAMMRYCAPSSAPGCAFASIRSTWADAWILHHEVVNVVAMLRSCRVARQLPVARRRGLTESPHT
jgi:hypothetical protein